MKQLWVYLCVIGVWMGSVAWAQLPQIEDYSGDLWSRPALTGDWGGFRNTMAKRGINLDVDLVQGVQGLNSGGSFRNHDSIRYPYGGHAEYTLNVDTGKLGLWPGGFLSIMGESQFGSYLQGKETGALLPPNAAALYPMPFDDTTTLTSVVFTQFLAKWFGHLPGQARHLRRRYECLCPRVEDAIYEYRLRAEPGHLQYLPVFDVGRRIDPAPH